jgi:ribosomal RNA assembly protein
MASDEFMYELRIPRDRIAVLIGKKGEVKQDLEKITKTNISVDSKEGLVEIKGSDALLLYSLKEIIRAIGRGFNPETAKFLLKIDYGFELIPLSDNARNQKDLLRIKGRIIGEGGKARKTIENLTQTNICVYGKTVGIIGPMDCIFDARKAIENLLSGGSHAKIYKWLEKRKKDRKIIF